MFGDAREVFAAIVVENFGLTPFVEQDVFIAVIIVIAPHPTHAHARARFVDIGETDAPGYVFEGSVPEISIESILTVFPAVADVEVVPAILVEIHHGNRRAH